VGQDGIYQASSAKSVIEASMFPVGAANAGGKDHGMDRGDDPATR
jgi:hypothetical protein